MEPTLFEMMGSPHYVDPAEPQTALSEGAGRWCPDLETIEDLASLDLARIIVARRRAADAVDHLIALMDALDAATEDMEEDDPGGTDLDLGEGDTADNEPMLGAPERHPFAYIFSGHRRTRDGRQTHWSAGRNDGANDGEAEPGYDLPEGDDERCGSGDVDEEHNGDNEPSLGAPEVQFGRDEPLSVSQVSWARGGDDDREDDKSDAEPSLAAIEGDENLSSNFNHNDVYGADMEQDGWRRPRRRRVPHTHAPDAVAREARRQVDVILRRKVCATVARDPNEIRPGNLVVIAEYPANA